MIYIITFILIIVLFIFLYHRKKKNRIKYISDLINSINQYSINKKNKELKDTELKKNIINDMGNIIAYPNPNNFYDLKNTDFTLQVPNYLEKVYYKKI